MIMMQRRHCLGLTRLFVHGLTRLLAYSASHDILRLYDLRETRAFKHSTVPFLIIPGPPRAGVISSLYIDPSSRFMLSAAGTRGWEGTNTEVLIGYEIHVESNA
jgi:transcriptional activator SPT8